MCKLFMLPVAGVLALGAFNLSTGNDLLHVPGSRTIRSAVHDTLRDDVRVTVRGARDETEGAALTTKIKAKMALDDLVEASDIDVDTDGSVVTLTGDVGSRDEQRRAVRIATETKGVTRVVARLNVRD